MSNAIYAIQPGFGNTAPIQLEPDPQTASDDEGIQKLADYIRTICQKGSILLNINIINAGEILAQRAAATGRQEAVKQQWTSNLPRRGFFI
jgi:formate C-acetyltransferase